ncbi:MAG: ornithine--oxo-acid transaminase [Candidatus Yanofskybacteria bacterium RIFCSPLOWO2_01_FULL_44_22]|uniref:ornithine aminotransferase n=2 Tax=Candidatus Yanofskyibacteriota TaxID=1752733 RepID=A0A1F8GQJ6_9BACT|nr:MAG: Acetylornithine/succinyldiaminopimelate aminotransferase [Candidatus Yanofskybacteria bacterium GW2011_GWA2_44_9]OGN05197.1 MAG: ornithine--oxo-acid transaminase [Candidatus Yanofskybacteria bacterium RIFCSPHIGHO2_01_FULL_44_24]OGN26918.1 MAG: ornithine--oxo-acid transaminase [Candidatus Yanofskybacteria bacterium RIFCSPLOWO2_01_FULL_44_22]
MIRSGKFIEQTESFSAHNYHPLPVVLTRGSGVWVWDVDDKKYLDTLSAYSAQNFGHCHPRIVSVLIEQAKRLAVTSRAFYSDRFAEFSMKLAQFCQMDMVLPGSGGAESVETAIKLSRKWGYERKRIRPNSAEIIMCSDNFHGRTTTIISGSDSSQARKNFGPLTSGFKIIPFGDPDALGRAITPNTVAFLVEPVQGEGGINVPPDGYFQEVRRICDRYRVLLVLDEIQTGMGRTGYDLAHFYENIYPDVLILGKALGGGMLPVSAVVGWRHQMDVFRPGDHGSTFGGNPLACAVAIEALDVLREENLAERARDLGGYFMGELKKIKSRLIKEVRGRGLMIGLELNGGKGIGRRFCEAILRKGVLCKDTKENVIRLAPPLVIGKAEIDAAVLKIRETLLEMEGIEQ